VVVVILTLAHWVAALGVVQPCQVAQIIGVRQVVQAPPQPKGILALAVQVALELQWQVQQVQAVVMAFQAAAGVTATEQVHQIKLVAMAVQVLSAAAVAPQIIQVVCVQVAMVAME
jgi:hypothetical protein